MSVDFLRHLQASLAAPPMDDETLRRKLEDNFTLLEAFAATWQALASERDPSLPTLRGRERQASAGCVALVLQPVARG